MTLMILIKLKQFFCLLIEDQKAATAIEYGLIVALVAVVIISALTLIGTELNATFNFIGNSVNNVNS